MSDMEMQQNQLEVRITGIILITHNIDVDSDNPHALGGFPCRSSSTLIRITVVNPPSS